MTAGTVVSLGVAAGAIGGLSGTTVKAPDAAPAQPLPAAADQPKPSDVFSVRSDWDITQTKNEEVDFFIEFLQWKNHDKTKLWLERMGKYGPMIQQKLAELPAGTRVLGFNYDTGERYLSVPDFLPEI